jgi:hypothetical protein
MARGSVTGGRRSSGSGGGGGVTGGSGGASTTAGKAKKLAEPSKKYEAPNKNSGKVKYQNVIKEARIEPKKAAAPSSLAGKRLKKEQIERIIKKNPNLAKQIDREYKEQKGVRTAKPTTPKVPTKKSAPRNAKKAGM